MKRAWPSRLTVAALAGFMAAAAAADEDAGIVKRLRGSVTLQRGEQSIVPVPGAPVRVGDRFVTGSDGGVGVTMADDTLLTVGPNSTLVISEFRFDSTTNEGGLLASLWKGTLHIVTGLIAKQQPRNVNVQTRNALMGVRGTDFIVDARGDAK